MCDHVSIRVRAPNPENSHKRPLVDSKLNVATGKDCLFFRPEDGFRTCGCQTRDERFLGLGSESFDTVA